MVKFSTFLTTCPKPDSLESEFSDTKLKLAEDLDIEFSDLAFTSGTITSTLYTYLLAVVILISGDLEIPKVY